MEKEEEFGGKSAYWRRYATPDEFRRM